MSRSLWDEPIDFQRKALHEYYKITFVRNPLVRLVSGYRNKIIRDPGSGAGHYITIIEVISDLYQYLYYHLTL